MKFSSSRAKVSIPGETGCGQSVDLISNFFSDFFAKVSSNLPAGFMFLSPKLLHY